jgi:hypothetical protein
MEGIPWKVSRGARPKERVPWRRTPIVGHRKGVRRGDPLDRVKWTAYHGKCPMESVSWRISPGESPCRGVPWISSPGVGPIQRAITLIRGTPTSGHPPGDPLTFAKCRGQFPADLIKRTPSRGPRPKDPL